MAKEGEHEEEDFEVVEQGSPEDKRAEEEAKKSAENKDGDEGADDDSDEGADDADQSLASGGRVEHKESKDPAQTSANAERRRKRKKALKEKLDQKDALLRSQQATIRQLNERLTAQESRSGAHERAMLDKALMDAKDNLVKAKSTVASSLTTNDPNAVAEANELYYTARKRVDDLEGVVKQFANQGANTGIQTPNVGIAQNMNAWMARNQWFRAGSTDRDSRIAKVIDNEVAEEGFDPSTPEYWAELDRRIAETLPHRAKHRNNDDSDDEDDIQDQSQSQRQRQTVEHRQTVSSSGQGGGGPARKKITLSKERIQAIKDAGYWDNPTERNKMIRQYMDYDRQNNVA